MTRQLLARTLWRLGITHNDCGTGLRNIQRCPAVDEDTGAGLAKRDTQGQAVGERILGDY